nr:Gmad2 immunoglobulin-like domain-containing protein [Nocardioides perillae]
MSDRRPWTYAAAGAAVAAAAVVVAVAVAGGSLTGGDDDPAPAAGEPTPTAAEPTPEPSAAPSSAAPSSAAPPAGEAVVVPAYYVGEGPRGPVLFREFHETQVAGGDVALAAAQEVVGGDPLDPDYRSVWPAGTEVAAVAVQGGVARVDLTAAPPRGDLTEREAELAVQGVVYSVQGALQERLPVQLTVDGKPVAEVLGVPTAEPLAQAPLLETLSLMSITTPAEGATVGDTFTAEGVSNGFEANVQWQVLDGAGAVVAEGYTTAEGWMEERLFPWSAEVDVSGLEPGTYTFLARTDDPSGGAEGGGPDEDTRTVTVE